MIWIFTLDLIYAHVNEDFLALPFSFFLWLQNKVSVSTDMQLYKVQYLYLFQYLGVLTQTHLKFWSLGFIYLTKKITNNEFLCLPTFCNNHQTHLWK